MKNLGESKTIFYFDFKGRRNLSKTVELVVERVKELKLNKVVVFTANGDGAFLLREKLLSEEIDILAVTFPYKQQFQQKKEDGSLINVIPETSLPETRKRFEELKITLVQGTMPFQDIIIPGIKDTKIQTINYTLSLISGGLRLCVQAILMATDAGYIEPGEVVIAMSADTAIVARSCISPWLFHPTEGMGIYEIICKPGFEREIERDV